MVRKLERKETVHSCSASWYCAPLAVSFVSIFRSSSLLFGFLASFYLALQMRILPFSFFAYNFFIHP